MEDKKDTNPKDAIGIKKAGLQCVSCAFIFALAQKAGGFSLLYWPSIFEVGLAMLEGARKYGRHNYRVSGVRASVYYDAIMRHINQWWIGETIDKDSQLCHTTKALACMAVFLDAINNSKWIDDRPPKVNLIEPGLKNPSNLASYYYEEIIYLVMRWWEGGEHDDLVQAAYVMLCLRESMVKDKLDDDRPKDIPVNWLPSLHEQVKTIIKMYPDCVSPYTEEGQKTALLKCNLCNVPAGLCEYPLKASTTRNGCDKWTDKWYKWEERQSE